MDTTDITKRETAWVAGCAAGTVLATSLPFVLGYLLAPPGLQFTGLVPYLDDGNSYLAKMLMGAQGDWLFRLPFTPEEHSGGPFFLFYIILGKIGATIGWPMILTLHFARVAMGLLLLGTAYLFIAEFVVDRFARRLAFVLVCATSGTGWLLMIFGLMGVLGEVPFDAHFPDATTYWNIFSFPHYSLSVLLMLLSFLLILRSFHSGRMLPGAGAAVCAALLALVHPSVVVVWVVAGLYLVWLWAGRRDRPGRELGSYLLVLGASAPVVALEMYEMARNPAFAGWNEQNFNFSPSPANFLLSAGPVYFLAVLGAAVLIRKGREEDRLPAIWGLVVPVLLYMPTSVQRRLLEGWHVPLSILVAVGLCGVIWPRIKESGAWHWVRSRRPGWTDLSARKRLASLVVILLIPSNLFITCYGLVVVARAERPVYLSVGEVEALRWLDDNTADEETVLSGFTLGNIIPGRSGNRVVLGHWSETLRAREKQVEVQRFFEAGTPDEERKLLLQRYEVSYVYYGADERRLGGFDPAAAVYLSPAFGTGDATIFRVEDTALSSPEAGDRHRPESLTGDEDADILGLER